MQKRCRLWITEIFPPFRSCSLSCSFICVKFLVPKILDRVVVVSLVLVNKLVKLKFSTVQQRSFKLKLNVRYSTARPFSIKCLHFIYPTSFLNVLKLTHIYFLYKHFTYWIFNFLFRFDCVYFKFYKCNFGMLNASFSLYKCISFSSLFFFLECFIFAQWKRKNLFNKVHTE